MTLLKETPSGTDRIHADIEAHGHTQAPLVLTSWPATYARQYVCAHPAVVGWQPESSDAPDTHDLAEDAIAAYCHRTRQDPVEVMVALADAALNELGCIPITGLLRANRLMAAVKGLTALDAIG